MLEPLELLGQAIWFILPAYVANGTPVVFGGGPPIDGGKKLSDGFRIFGDGKTTQGFLLGLLGGIIIGLIQNFIWGRPGGWTISILLALGALLGDLVGSFLKRRMGLRRGSSAIGLDQLEFLVGALLLASIIEIPKIAVIITLLIATPFIHKGTNYVGYKLGLKSNPY